MAASRPGAVTIGGRRAPEAACGGPIDLAATAAGAPSHDSWCYDADTRTVLVRVAERAVRAPVVASI